MAVPSYGVSQRFELSIDYVRTNESSSSEHLLHPRIRPSDNVAERGQVVLLSSNANESQTQVVPDAAGYRLPYNPKALAADKLRSCLNVEISKYRIGVNQVEKGVATSHKSMGYGWDISCVPGQPVTVLHTGSEPIRRFDYVGVRFPTDADQKAQRGHWGDTNPTCKFATYPVRENLESVKYTRFHYDVDAFRCAADIGSAASNPVVQYQQLPALFGLVGAVANAVEHEDCRVREEVERCKINPASVEPEDTPLVNSDPGFMTLLTVAKKAVDFCTSLNPPAVLARVVDFEGPQPHRTSHAECGCLMKCEMMAY